MYYRNFFRTRLEQLNIRCFLLVLSFAVMIALRNGEVRIYKDKYLVNMFKAEVQAHTYHCNSSDFSIPLFTWKSVTIYLIPVVVRSLAIFMQSFFYEYFEQETARAVFWIVMPIIHSLHIEREYPVFVQRTSSLVCSLEGLGVKMEHWSWRQKVGQWS